MFAISPPRNGPLRGRRLDASNPNERTHASHSYAVCRNRQARSQELLLRLYCACHEPRRNAICAIYAFMRKADDLSDDESISREERRSRLMHWQANWRRGHPGRADQRSGVYCRARCDARFAIPLSLLDELVAGSHDGPGSRGERRARHVRNICRSLSLLLPGGIGGGPGLHSDLRLYRSCALKSWRKRQALRSS